MILIQLNYGKKLLMINYQKQQNWKKLNKLSMNLNRRNKKIS